MPGIANYGLLGCGMMGQEHIRNVGLLSGARIAAFHDPDQGMSAAAAALAPDAYAVDALEDLVGLPEIDALIIASPNHLHVEHLARTSRIRELPILVEKPLFSDPADAAWIESFSAAYPAPVWVAMEYRYMPPIARLVAEAERATGGARMLTIREHRFPFLPKVGDWNRFNRCTGGTFVEKCCHFFDLMRLILNSEPVRVTASAGQAVNHLDERYGGETPDIWDHGYVVVEFDSGAKAMLELCMFADGSEYQEEISAVGPRGKIECFAPGPRRFWPEESPAPVPKLVISPREPKGPREVATPVDEALLAAGDHNGATYHQHERFLEVVRGRAAPEVTLRDGARAVAMGHAAQRSVVSGNLESP